MAYIMKNTFDSITPGISLMTNLHKIAFKLNKSVSFAVVEKICTISAFFYLNKEELNRFKLKCILINSTEEEAFAFASFQIFPEIILILNEEFHDIYNEVLAEYNLKIDVCKEDIIPNTQAFFYFGNGQNIEAYKQNITNLSFILIENQYVNLNDNSIEFGKVNPEFAYFTIISRNNHHDKAECDYFNKLDYITSNRAFKEQHSEIQTLSTKLKKIYRKCKYDDSIKNSNFYNKKGLIINWVNQIYSQLNPRSDDVISLINQIHLLILSENNSELIPILIKFINASAYYLIKRMKDAIDDNKVGFFLEFQNFGYLIQYGFSSLICDIITHINIAEFFITQLNSLFTDDSRNFKVLKENVVKIKTENIASNERFFNFLHSDLKNHLSLLLENESIKNGYIQLDSFQVKESSVEEAKCTLMEILLDQSTNDFDELDEYEITQIGPRTCQITPSESLLRIHLERLIPNKLVIIPSEVFDFVGQTLIGGTICITDDLLSIDTIENRACVFVTIIHEMSHKKRLIFANSNKLLPNTPEKFFKESGLFIDKFIYGENIGGAGFKPSGIDREIAEAILSRRQLTEDQANKIFLPQKNAGFMPLSDCEEEDEILLLCHPTVKRRIDF